MDQRGVDRGPAITRIRAVHRAVADGFSVGRVGCDGGDAEDRGGECQDKEKPVGAQHAHTTLSKDCGIDSKKNTLAGSWSQSASTQLARLYFPAGRLQPRGS